MTRLAVQDQCLSPGIVAATAPPCVQSSRAYGVQVYNASVTAGAFEENLLTTMSGTDWGRIREVDLVMCISPCSDSQCSSLEREDFFPESELNDRWRPFDLNVTESDPARFSKSPPDDTLSLLENGCLHLVSPDSLFDLMEQYLQGFVQATSSSGVGNDVYPHVQYGAVVGRHESHENHKGKSVSLRDLLGGEMAMVVIPL